MWMTRETSSSGTAAAGRAVSDHCEKVGVSRLGSRNEQGKWPKKLTAFSDPDPLEVVLQDDRVLPVVHLRMGQDALVFRLEVLANEFPQDVEPETTCWRESDFDYGGEASSRLFRQ